MCVHNALLTSLLFGCWCLFVYVFVCHPFVCLFVCLIVCLFVCCLLFVCLVCLFSSFVSLLPVSLSECCLFGILASDFVWINFSRGPC